MKKILPNKIYLASKSWLGVNSRLKKSKKTGDTSVRVAIQITPELFAHVKGEPSCIARARAKGYLEMNASRGDDGKIYLSGLIEQNMGDEDGFGVEPDDYLVGIVTADGTIVEPLHIV